MTDHMHRLHIIWTSWTLSLPISTVSRLVTVSASRNLCCNRIICTMCTVYFARTVSQSLSRWRYGEKGGGGCGSGDGWGAMLHAGRSRVRIPMRSQTFFSVYLILPAALAPGVYSTSNRNEYQHIFLGVKRGRRVGLTTAICETTV
jgi:hypothetical protein